MTTTYSRRAPGLGFISTATLEQIAQEKGRSEAALWAAQNMPQWAIDVAATEMPWLTDEVAKAKAQLQQQQQKEAADKALKAIEEYNKQKDGSSGGIPTWVWLAGAGAILVVIVQSTGGKKK